MKANKNKHIIKHFQVIMLTTTLVAGLFNGNIYAAPLKAQEAAQLSVDDTANIAIPTLNITIDESKGTIEDMNSDVKHNKRCYGSINFTIPDYYTAEYDTIGIESGKDITLDYIKGRGNYSWNNGDKKPYKIKLKQKENLFGMGANKHWVLLTNNEDYTCLKNKIVLHLADEIGMKYVSKGVFVDVFMNGTYLGNYLLAEQVRVGKTRVNIDDIDESKEDDVDTLTGGYLINKDENAKDEENSFPTERAYYEIVSPSIEYTTEERKNYISDYVQRIEDAVYSEDFYNAQGERYSDLMDTDSFIDYFLIQFFSANFDAFRNSTYFYKERGGKLYWGPVWDFDFSMQASSDSTTCITAEHRYMGKQLVNDPEIARRILERYLEIRSTMVGLYQNGGYIDQNVKQIETSVHNDYEKWQRTQCYEDQIEGLKEWIDARIRFMDSYLPTLIKEHYVVTFDLKNGSLAQEVYAVPGSAVELIANPKRENYTFDGWYYVEDGEEKEFTKDTSVKDNMTVTAKWKPNKKAAYILNLDANGGIIKGIGGNLQNNVMAIPVTEDTTVHLQVSAQRDGYTFAGWYTDEKSGDKVDPSSALSMNQNTTFYAHWDKVSVNKGKITKLKAVNAKKLKISIEKTVDAGSYELVYADNKYFNHAVKKTLTKTSYTVGNVKKGKTYYTKVRNYKIDSTGKKIYGKYSSIKKVKIS